MMRPSTQLRVRTWTDVITRAVIGLTLLGGGGFFLYLEMSHPPAHNAHVFTFAGIAVFGAFLLKPDSMLTVSKQIVVIVSPFWPFKRGETPKDGTP